jgi:hypothetical protein
MVILRGVLRLTCPSRELVLPMIVTMEDPAGAAREVLMERLTVAGALAEGETVAGVNLQLAPTGKPLQVRVTAPANDPEAATERLTGWELVPRGTLIVAGTAAARLKSTTFT